MKKFFKEQPLCAFRRDRNLCDMIVHQKNGQFVKNNTTVKPKTKPRKGCGRNCVICQNCIWASVKQNLAE